MNGPAPEHAMPYTARQFLASERVYERIEALKHPDVDAELAKAYAVDAEDDPKGQTTA